MTIPTNSLQWPEMARSLSARVGEDWLQPAVREFLVRESTKRVLVACSGGPDSVCLLGLLWANSGLLGIECVVAHYNHRWRGDASELDAEFVRELAGVLNCDFVTESRPEREAAFTETTARALRLDFLRKAAREYDCSCIAFGHQQCDILETQLQRLARGSGTDGLAAPRPVNYFDGLPTHIRPLLKLRAGDVRMALACSGLPWRDDSSNEDQSIARNALRHTIIPALGEALGRDVSAASARSRRLLEEDSVALDRLARAHFSTAFSASPDLDRQALREAPVALTRRAVTAWLASHGLLQSLSATGMDLLIDAIYSDLPNDKQSAGSRFIVLKSTKVCIEATVAEPIESLDTAFLEAGESLILPTGAVLETEWVEVDDDLRMDIKEGAVDARSEAFVALNGACMLQVRSWQAGDRFRPLGSPGSRKLQDWFIDKQIPRRERKQLPIVVLESGQILWVPGFAPADSHKITAETKLALRLTYQRGVSL
jgi:tRNA(Ile)-lysidine synthase